MNKKKLTSMLVSLGLVAALGAGATLAALTAETEELTNKFTFTTQGINISLSEAKVNELTNVADPTKPRVEAGDTQEYKNLLPNMEIDKDPTVTVEQGSLNCNVFVSVKNENPDAVLKVKEYSSSWTEITPQDADGHTKYFVYAGTRGEGTKEGSDTLSVVDASEAEITLEDVFEQVVVGNLTGKVTFKEVVIKAAAVQADNVTDKEATDTALAMLGYEAAN